MQTPDEAAREMAGALYVAMHQDRAWAQAAWDDMGGSEPSEERALLEVAALTLIRERDAEVRDQIRAEEVDPLAVLLAATREGLARSASKAKGVTQVREMLAEHAGHIYAVAEAAHYRRGRTKPREDRGKAASEALSRP